MDVTNERPLRLKVWGSLRLRLTAAVVFIVLVVTGAAMVLDYRREHRVHMDGLRASLTEQAQALRVARNQIRDSSQFAQYIDDFCAQMNEHISPGHHVLVLGRHGEILASTRHHSGLAVEEALLSVDGQSMILKVNGHKLAQVRLKDDDGATIILAQYLDHVESILYRQLVSRAATTGAMALAIIVLIFLALHFWSIRPIEQLVKVAEAWSTRVFSSRADPTGPSEIRLLAEKFNSMAEQLEKTEQKRTDELERARQIQTNLLPKSMPSLGGLSVATEYCPVEHVAGDLYDIFELSDGRVAFVILDVAGHGITAALLTGVVKMSLHRRLAEREDLAAAIALVNEDLLRCVSDGQFVTVCVGVWNAKDRTWTYCGAGHPGGLLLSGDTVRSMPSTGPLLGVTSELNWSSEVLHLSEGDELFLYTDGIIEAGTPHDKLGETGLITLLKDIQSLSLSDQVRRVIEETYERDLRCPADDRTIIALKVCEHPG